MQTHSVVSHPPSTIVFIANVGLGLLSPQPSSLTSDQARVGPIQELRQSARKGYSLIDFISVFVSLWSTVVAFLSTDSHRKVLAKQTYALYKNAIRLNRLATFLLLFVLVGLSRANDLSDSAGHDAANDRDRLLEQGIALREKERDLEALELFRRAIALAPNARGRAQIGMAEQALGQWAASESDLLAALQDEADAWICANRTVLQRALQTVQRRLCRLEIVGGIHGAEVVVDGKAMGRLPLARPLRLVAGRVILEVRLDGYYPVRREVLLAPEKRGREAVELQPISNVLTMPVVPPATRSPPPRRLPWWLPVLVASVAVTSVGIGSGLLGSAATEYNGLERSCAPGCSLESWRALPARASAGEALLGIAAGFTIIDAALWGKLAHEQRSQAAAQRGR